MKKELSDTFIENNVSNALKMSKEDFEKLFDYQPSIIDGLTFFSIKICINYVPIIYKNGKDELF